MSTQEERIIAAKHSEDCCCDACTQIRDEYENATW